jgi:hypothetical protein
MNKMLAVTALLAFSCAVLSAAELERETADSSLFGLSGAKADISLPTPRASKITGESADAAGDEALFKYIGEIFKAPRPMQLDMGYSKSIAPVASGRSGDVAYSFKLDKILNSYIDAGLAFNTADGTKVRLSGYTAANCPDGGSSCADKERFFLIFAVGHNEFHFARAVDIVNSLFSSGLKNFTIKGEEYTVRIHAELPINASKIKISRGKDLVLSPTLKELGDAVGGKASSLKLGRKYTLAYGNELIQAKGGAKFNNKLVIVMSPVGVDGFYFLNRSDITPEGVTYPDMEPGYGFRIVDDTLQIFKLL